MTMPSTRLVVAQGAAQRQGSDDDAQVVDGDHEGGQGELPAGIEQGRGDAGEAQEEHGREDDAHQIDGLLADLGGEAHAQDGDQLRREGDGQGNHGDERQGRQVDHRAAHAAEVVGAVVGVLREDRNERGRDGAADEQVIDHGGHGGGGHEGVGDAGGAEEPGDDLLADDAQQAAGHVAQGDDQCGVGDSQRVTPERRNAATAVGHQVP